MQYLVAIYEMLLALVKAIPALERIFTKPTEKKVSESQSDVEKEKQEFKKTGRPS